LDVKRTILRRFLLYKMLGYVIALQPFISLVQKSACDKIIEDLQVLLGRVRLHLLKIKLFLDIVLRNIARNDLAWVDVRINLKLDACVCCFNRLLRDSLANVLMLLCTRAILGLKVIRIIPTVPEHEILLLWLQDRLWHIINLLINSVVETRALRYVLNTALAS
jgi:hypothetical protein